MKPAEDLAERLRAIRESPTYRLAYEDIELLGQDELRPLRLQLELLKPERILREQGINSTTRASPQKSNAFPTVMHRAAMDHGMHF